MQSDIQVLIDSDAFIGSLLEGDAHFQEAGAIFDRLQADRLRLATTSAVVAETITVLSHRTGQHLAKTFLEEVIESGNFPVVHITPALHIAALQIFKSQTKKGTSYTDCANVAVSQSLQVPLIFSFDQVYPKTFGLQLASTIL